MCDLLIYLELRRVRKCNHRGPGSLENVLLSSVGHLMSQDQINSVNSDKFDSGVSAIIEK